MFFFPTRPISGSKYLLPLLLAVIGLTVLQTLPHLAIPDPFAHAAHRLLEFSGVILGFITFFITWYGTNRRNNLQTTTISLVILCVSILDAAHLLSCLNLAGPVAEGQISGNLLWSAARLIWTLGLLYALILTNGQNHSISGNMLLYATILLVVAIAVNIYISAMIWPQILNLYQILIVCTPYLSIAVQLLLLLLLQQKQPHFRVTHLFSRAVSFAVLTDYCFFLSSQSPDLVTFIGHVCQVAAHYYLLRAMYDITIKKPYEDVSQIKEEMEALADNNAKLYEQSEKQRNMIEDTLAKIGMIITSQLDLQDTYDAIVDIVADMMHARQSSIALLHQDRSTLEVAATYGISSPPEFIPMENSLAEQVLADKTALYIDDVSLDPKIFRPQLVFSEIRSIICAPLINDQQIIGVIEAYSHEKAGFSEHDARLLKALGHYAGAAITAAKLYRETQVRLEEEQYLQQITQISVATIDPDTILTQSLNHLKNALHADIGLGFLYNASNNSMTLKASIGYPCPFPEFNLDQYPQLTSLLRDVKPVKGSIDMLPFMCADCTQNPMQNMLILPLSVDHRILGMLILGRSLPSSASLPYRMSFAELLAQQIALGLEKAHLYNQVKSMALSDGLTGLANRRNFDLFLETELRRAASLRRPLSLIMFDLDKFKNYNDTYGHPVGDKLLTQIGDILRQNVRGIDFPARYGGEEFSVILPECSNAEALAIAEKLRQIVAASQFPDNSGGNTGRITASQGVATYDPLVMTAAPSPEQIIASADKALYQAKQGGRNLVVNAALVG
ncbi:diguanylate cyclase [Acetonema longum]|uniref:Diguanylate cyclase with GAF sensor n=1 Tax=Acetonema longum DSM 6540 TaxID=1009370 RepID=F7NDF3_9FIRM|nr:diguanylate cyclase [Acetonema longum]EGO65906.1 diguanylate cyclase with GAF sensor [Acetonema longum DSM 6540]